MSRFVAVSIAIITLIALGIRGSADAQTIYMTSPQNGAMFQQVGGFSEITGSADASGLPAGGGVEFVLDAGAYNWRTQTDLTPPYSCSFTGVAVGEHTLDAYPVAGNGLRIGTPDHRQQIGVGDIIIAMGDSITAGEIDDILTDNWSADGRTGPHIDEATGIEYGGFEPILADILANQCGYPVMVVNKGVPGDTSWAAVANAYSIALEYPTARTWILAYGTNDTGGRIAAATVKSNLQTAIQRIREINPSAEFYIPKILFNQKYDSTVTEYHNKIGDITRNVDGVRWGADLDTLFRANHILCDHLTGQAGTWLGPISSHHPNGIGVQKMAMLWKLAMVDNVLLVTDGVPGTVGNTWADQLRLDGTDTVGLSESNLLLVRPQSPVGSPPAGTSFVCQWAHDIHLTGAGYFAGGPLTATVRVEEDNLPRVGATTWNQVWLASNSVLLPTSRVVDPRNAHNYDLSAPVTQVGQLACVADVTPPVSTHTINPTGPELGNVWYVDPPLVTLSATDSTAMPVSAIVYRWDSGPEQTYVGPFTALKGAHTLYYHSIDQSGNVEQDKPVTILVVGAPSVPIVSDNARYALTTDTIDATWYVQDPGSGVAQYQYAVGTLAGDCDLQAWTSVGTATGVSWQPRNVKPGATFYFAVKAYSSDWQCSPVGYSDGVAVPIAVGTIGRAKLRPDDTPVLITRMISTAAFDDVLYIEGSDRSAGIGAYGVQATPDGLMSTVVGRMATVNGQHAIVDAEVRDPVTASIPRPISVNAANLRLDTDARGPSTHGLLVKVYGRVTSSGSNWFRLSDGSLRSSGTLYVDAGHLSTIPGNGSIAYVTGICTSVFESGMWKPSVTPRGDEDIQRIR